MLELAHRIVMALANTLPHPFIMFFYFVRRDIGIVRSNECMALLPFITL
ncbi:hypothetical protein P4S64_03185 [Vibrio sp. M60_M31a]